MLYMTSMLAQIMSGKLYYTEKELPQRSSKWLKIREGCIGASDVAEILYINDKFHNPYKLWQRKTKKIPPKKSNPAMLRGAELEPEALKAIKKELKDNFGVKRPKIEQFFAKHPEFPYIGVSFDGVDVKNAYIVEIKCPNNVWNFRTVFENGIQEYYYPQVQLQLYVANAIWGINKAYFCSYFPDGAYILNRFEYKEYFKQLVIVDVDLDLKYCEEMRKVIKKFYDCMTYDAWDSEKYEEILKEFKNKCQITA